MSLLDGRYQDTATFVEATSGGYANSKTMLQQVEVEVIFVQSTDHVHSNFQDVIDADAICSPNPDNSFIMSMFNRLEGLYILMPLYGAADSQSWFKVSKCVINRDHLLNNLIDNIELQLKKCEAVPGVS